MGNETSSSTPIITIIIVIIAGIITIWVASVMLAGCMTLAIRAKALMTLALRTPPILVGQVEIIGIRRGACAVLG